MELIEREEVLLALKAQLETIKKGEGHCVFISGESGIGKTALVKAFSKDQNECRIYHGTCDALFTPRPLAPLYDILWQMQKGDIPSSHTIEERSSLFLNFFRELRVLGATIVVFEDIHWADEATLDFIKFFARRISQVPCLFILTFRDDEVHSRHPLRNVLGQLPADSFSKIVLSPLSQEAVKKLSAAKGYDGDEVYTVSGGNPFYVTEMLASYYQTIPENVKDAIVAAYSKHEVKTREVWDLLSVVPTRLELKYLEQLEPHYLVALERCFESKILIVEEGTVFFKHELFRRAVESSLSPMRRIALNKRLLDILIANAEPGDEIERIIHHAKNANDYDTVIRFTPVAAAQAALMGAHIEASRLYLTTIEYYQGNDTDTLIRFYEAYAYECYLTNQVKEAIIYTGRALSLWRDKNDIEHIGNSLRFLSRLWWFEGTRIQAESFAGQAIEVLADQPDSTAKAMAFSTMAQLKCLMDEPEQSVLWGQKAIDIAKALNDEQTLAHALNSVGASLMTIRSSRQQGTEMVTQSLEIARNNGFHEHEARALTSLGSTAIVMQEYKTSELYLNKGINFCEEKDLDSQRLYLLGFKARLLLETDRWKEAMTISSELVTKEKLLPVIRIGALIVIATIRMRQGDEEVVPLLREAKTLAFNMMEPQRILSVMAAGMEYEWITGESCIDDKDLDRSIAIAQALNNPDKTNQFYYWLGKTGRGRIPLKDSQNKRRLDSGSVYEHAIMLFEGTESDKKQAITMVHELEANAVYEKMKREMKRSGIKSIPRGIRKTTRANTAFLTSRELDVLQLLKAGLQNKEIATRLFISAKTVDHHISSILFKLDVNSRIKAVSEAIRQEIIK